MFREFRKESFCLAHYRRRVSAILLPCLLVAVCWREVLWFFPVLIMMTSVRIQLVMASVVVAIALIHNASHGSLRPWWLNQPVGELMGLFQLTGFPDRQATQVLHGTYTVVLKITKLDLRTSMVDGLFIWGLSSVASVS